MAGKIRRLAPTAVVVAAAATLFAASTAVAAPNDPMIDITATIESTTFSEDLEPGETFTTQFSFSDNMNDEEQGVGEDYCLVATPQDDAARALCLTVLGFDDGSEVHIVGLYSIMDEPQTGLVIGGTGDYEGISGLAQYFVWEDDDEMVMFRLVVTPLDMDGEASDAGADLTDLTAAEAEAAAAQLLAVHAMDAQILAAQAMDAQAANGPDADAQNMDAQLPDLQQPDIQEPDLQQPDLQQPDIQQPDIQEPDLQEPDLQQPDIQQPDMDQSGAAEPYSVVARP